MVTLLEGRDAVRKAQSQANVVKAFQQAFATEGIDLKGNFEAKVICNGLVLEVNAQPVSLIVLGQLNNSFISASGSVTRSTPFLKQLL